ncbi:conserved hypothetical protein [Ricinus communis]|uniref:Uncharacterized protein n=1 Tax=Ricinus communis TaxID=3988 RepID=B9SNF7_RICCO|nr:conserved hypothetical protein [Ricinus communis]
MLVLNKNDGPLARRYRTESLFTCLGEEAVIGAVFASFHSFLSPGGSVTERFCVEEITEAISTLGGDTETELQARCPVRDADNKHSIDPPILAFWTDINPIYLSSVIKPLFASSPLSI